jgi:hypothetical protein
MEKLKKLLYDPRYILALTIGLALPSFVFSIAFGYIPLVAMILLYMAGIPFAYLAIRMFFIPVGGWIIQGVKWIINKIKGN